MYNRSIGIRLSGKYARRYYENEDVSVIARTIYGWRGLRDCKINDE